jgi:hypothetical protein
MLAIAIFGSLSLYPLSSILNLLSVALLLKIETYKRISLAANYFQDHHTAVRR